MKYFIIVLFLTFFINVADATPINPMAYQAMRAQSYRNNYNRQINNRPMPYWQAQSNYSTRNKMYNNYQNYTQYNNYVNQYKNYQRVRY